ncbi:hypothetical protein [Cyanobium sp. FACHB-13342]|uniref:hypothetical protein n=1 Tax=Cyanobium sp. FACHB-13342 TaxID=2692793 RepID=UPI00168075E3|nr:hypothetical protein [Cyanobium sp. FACHB-13342]MBD2421907.1 hypothetical protein [Cyanobium sp. FACHB-13342]
MPRPLALLMAAVLAIFYLDAFVIGASGPEVVAFILLGVLTVVGFRQHADHGPHRWPAVLPIVLGALGATAVQALSRAELMTMVSATALVGCLGALLERRSGAMSLAAPLYCGAFAGMTSKLVLHHPGWLVLAGALAGAVLTLLSNSWGGIGGKLGTTAFLSVFGICGLAWTFGALGAGAPLHAYSAAERLGVVIAAVASPLLTHWLSERCALGPIQGSALPSLLVGLLLPLLAAPLGITPQPLAVVWLGSSFVGMTAHERLGRHPQAMLIAMGLLFALFSLSFEPRLAGIGGDLGATAAVSVFTVLGARRLLPS